MDKFHDFMMRYTLFLWGCISGYCKSAESQAMNDKDLFVLGIGPVFILGLLLWSLPAFYLAFLLLRTYSVRTEKRK